MKKELSINPLMCGEFETKVKEKFKWLRQILSEGGLAQSVVATVEESKGKIWGRKLNRIQNWYYGLVYQVGPGAPLHWAIYYGIHLLSLQAWYIGSKRSKNGQDWQQRRPIYVKILEYLTVMKHIAVGRTIKI